MYHRARSRGEKNCTMYTLRGGKHCIMYSLCIVFLLEIKHTPWQRSDLGKNLVSDGHFCKSFCPAQPKISISSDLKHCYHLLTYPDCVMSEIHDILQNKILRNQLIMAASVMEFPSTTLKNVPVEKILLQN